MHDAIIIGGGHNGLVCGAYLAKAGLKVKVLERRDVIGGAAVTEEFSPGFRASIFSYLMSLLHPRVIRDLELKRHGLEILRPRERRRVVRRPASARGPTRRVQRRGRRRGPRGCSRGPRVERRC